MKNDIKKDKKTRNQELTNKVGRLDLSQLEKVTGGIDKTRTNQTCDIFDPCAGKVF